MTSFESSASDFDRQVAELKLFTTLGEGADLYYAKLASENPALGESAEALAT